MFRFTIRDVLWLMMVVGLGAGWFLNRRQLLIDGELWKSRANMAKQSLETVGYETEWMKPPGVIQMTDKQWREKVEIIRKELETLDRAYDDISPSP